MAATCWVVAVQRKVRSRLSLGAFSFCLSSYKLIYQGVSQDTSSLDINDVPACLRTLSMMKWLSARRWGKRLDRWFSSAVPLPLALDPMCSAPLAIGGIKLQAAFISDYIWNISGRAEKQTNKKTPTPTKNNPSVFNPKMFNIPRGNRFCLGWLLNPSV